MPDLTSYVEGLTALSIRCPNHDTVELAVDAANHLHLVGRATELRVMHAVAAWARDHVPVFLPDRDIAVEGDITWHLFTDQPASVADLQGTDIRLHLLAAVHVNGRETWICRRLN